MLNNSSSISFCFKRSFRNFTLVFALYSQHWRAVTVETGYRFRQVLLRLAMLSVRSLVERSIWVWSIGWIIADRGKRSTGKETGPSATRPPQIPNGLPFDRTRAIILKWQTCRKKSGGKDKQSIMSHFALHPAIHEGAFARVPKAANAAKSTQGQNCAWPLGWQTAQSACDRKV